MVDSVQSQYLQRTYRNNPRIHRCPRYNLSWCKRRRSRYRCRWCKLYYHHNAFRRLHTHTRRPVRRYLNRPDPSSIRSDSCRYSHRIHLHQCRSTRSQLGSCYSLRQYSRRNSYHHRAKMSCSIRPRRRYSIRPMMTINRSCSNYSIHPRMSCSIHLRMTGPPRCKRIRPQP